MILNIHEIIEQEKDKLNSNPELLKEILPVEADLIEFYNTNFDVGKTKDIDVRDIQSDITRIKLIAIDPLKDTI